MTSPRAVTIRPREYLDATEHLTPAQQAVLFRLLCHQWVTGLHETDVKELARLANTTPQHIGQSKKKLEPLLERDWTVPA